MERSSQVRTDALVTRAIRGINTRKKTENKDRIQLVEEIRAAMEELENIRKYFEFVKDPELIDYAIYSEKAAITKVSYLLKRARDK